MIASGPFEKGPLAGLEPLCIETPLFAGQEPDGGARGYALLSIAISLKRIADALDPNSDAIDEIAFRLGRGLEDGRKLSK